MDKKKLKKYIIFALLIALFIGTNIVFAEESKEVVTNGELHFCGYAGTRRALKIVGYAILIIKILVPFLIMFAVIKDLFTTMISGKPEELSKLIAPSIKRIIAAFAIFLIPTLINSTFDMLGYGDQGELEPCFTCVLDTANCKVEDGDKDDQEAQKITTEKTKKTK